MFRFSARQRPSAPTLRQREQRERESLRVELARATVRGDHARERRLLETLQAQEPTEPRWPHKLGDALHRSGDDRAAAACYRLAAKLYGELGFTQRRSALTRLARTLAGSSAPLTSLHPSIRPEAR